MKYLMAILLLLSQSIVSQAQVNHVSLSHLTGRVYVAVDSEFAKVNSVVYVGSNSVTVVGATYSPSSAKFLANEIKKVTTNPITEVINPDYNPEYAGGNAYWKSIGARIISTELTYNLLKNKWVSVGDFLRKYYPNYPHIPLALPTLTYPGNFKLQQCHVEAIYLGPSHTPDDIFIYFPKEKVLYAGSILKGHLGNMAFVTDVGKYIQTLHKLKQLHLPIRFIISGHWSAIHGPELLDHYLKMLENYSKNR